MSSAGMFYAATVSLPQLPSCASGEAHIVQTASKIFWAFWSNHVLCLASSTGAWLSNVTVLKWHVRISFM